jgi:hypothetical protein
MPAINKAWKTSLQLALRPGVGIAMRRAKVSLPNTNRGVPTSWVPRVREDRFMQCPVCGHLVDCQDLVEVVEHNDDYHLPPLKC